MQTNMERGKKHETGTGRKKQYAEYSNCNTRLAMLNQLYLHIYIFLYKYIFILYTYIYKQTRLVCVYIVSIISIISIIYGHTCEHISALGIYWCQHIHIFYLK